MFSFVNFEPPTKETQIITLNYFQWLLQANKVEEYKKCVEKNL